MVSKKLDSLLKDVPHATSTSEQQTEEVYIAPPTTILKKKEELTKIVASVPQDLKNQVKEYVKEHKGLSESALVIKGLKTLGFRVSSEHEVDRRTTR